MLTRLAARATVAWFGLRAALVVDGRDRERGDVPGWVLVTAMTVALVLAVWAIANQQITEIIRDALNKAKFGGP
jgi:hypothetical protein